MVQRLDHSLQVAVGFGLSQYIPSSPCGPLRDGTTRVLKKLRTGPDTKQARAWLRDEEGNLKLEIRRDQHDSVHFACDQGSVGSLGLLWLRADLGLRCTITWDPLHRCYNDWRGALTSAGMSVCLLEWKLATSVRHGPFRQQSTHSILRATAEEYFGRIGHKDDPLFVLLYDTIVQDSRELRSEPGIGTEAHYERVWRWCQSTCLHRGAECAELGRWFST